MPADKVLLSLGSNLGDKLYLLSLAVEYLGMKIDSLRASSVYQTSPIDDRLNHQQPVYFNMALSGITDLSPEEMLAFVHQVERRVTDKAVAMGYPVHEKRDKGPRYIDVDIVFLGDKVVHGDELRIPHPAYRDRLFVLIPVTEIEPEQRDPHTGERLLDIIDGGDFSGQEIKALGPLSTPHRFRDPSVFE